MTRFALALSTLALTCLPLATGCGEEGGEGAAEPPSDGTSPLAVAEEPPADPEAVTVQAAQGDFRGIDYEEYEAALEEMGALLDDYWERTFQEAFGESYGPPSDVIAYYPEEDAPDCGGQPAPPQNAIYCRGADFIAWDEPGLFIPFYRDKGDAAVGFVLGHEWGHLLQDRVGISGEFAHTIEAELQADCLAGAWAGDLDDQGLIEGGGPGEGGDIDEALDAIFAIGDPPEYPWQSPDAHGTGEQRATAFADGFEGGPETCEVDYGPGFTEEPGAEVRPRGPAQGDSLAGGE